MNETITFFMTEQNPEMMTDIECNERLVGSAFDLGVFEFGGIDGNSCGVENNLSETSSELVKIESGWSLRAVDVNLSEIPADVSIIWTYSDGNWSAFSPSGEYSNAIAENNFSTISTNLNSKNGTWFKSKNSLFLKTEKLDEVVDSYEPPKIPHVTVDKLGWSLVGTINEILPENVSCEENELSVLWRFDRGNWILHAPNRKTLDVIPPKSGFWVLCE
jgi:hypothetical protein